MSCFLERLNWKNRELLLQSKLNVAANSFAVCLLGMFQCRPRSRIVGTGTGPSRHRRDVVPIRLGAASPHFLKKLSKREVWIFDGCPVECSLGVFNVLQEHVDVHNRLHDLVVKKNALLRSNEEQDALIEAFLQQVASQK